MRTHEAPEVKWYKLVQDGGSDRILLGKEAGEPTPNPEDDSETALEDSN